MVGTVGTVTDMRKPGSLVAGTAVCVLVVCLLGACSSETVDGGPARAEGSPAAVATPADDRCRGLLPDGVLTALGWAAGAAATDEAGRCERRVEGSGAVTVTTRAATGGGDDPAREALDEQCEQLRSAGGYVDQPVAWLSPGSEASCATGLADTGTGVAELYVVNAVDELVQVRVEALAPVRPQQLQQAMSEVAAAAADLAP